MRPHEEEEAHDLSAHLGEICRSRGLTLAVAESCTGGLVMDLVTDTPGSSTYFLGGIVAYHNAVKKRLLGVRPETLAEHGAVSEPTAREMARGVRARLGADVGIAVTGIAGPTGGTPGKPVGLVYVAVSSPWGEVCERHLWSGDRLENKRLSALAALRLALRHLGQG
ncbi:MAG: CinA family protein [Anaerolineae bacterium]|nr:CinA family protein [Anaerolineae bacterium]